MNSIPEEKERSGQENLERCLLHGLSCEWEKALWVLSSTYREKMRPPLFRLKDMKGCWGIWSGSKREISLSRDLPLNHSWDSVREVLLHEMAHQFVHEVFLASDEPPHGPLFQKACHLLRANPRASGNYPPLDERIFGPESSLPQDRMLRKVKKLLALAESRNPHEADAAMAKAHDLIAKYNLTMKAGSDETRCFESAFVGAPALRHPPEDYALAHLLQDFYFVQGIWVPAYVAEKEKMGRVLEISGTIQNIRMAGYVHDFVRHFARAQWTAYSAEKQLQRHHRTDFTLGIIEGFRAKLVAQRKGGSRTSQALMKIEDPLLRKYLRYRYPQTAKVSRGGGRQDQAVWKDGLQAGQSLVIFQGIRDHGGSKGLLIANRSTN